MRYCLRALASLAPLLSAAPFAHAAGQVVWASDISGTLAKIDADSGVPTFVGPMGTTLTDLAFNPTTGQLWGVGGPGFQWLYSVNTTTGAATPIGDMGGPVNSLACAPDGTLYGAYGSFFTINTATAALTTISSLGTLNASGDLAFLGGNLYLSVIDPGGFGGSDVLISLNPVSGLGTLHGPIGTAGVWGLAGGLDGVLYGGVGNTIITINTSSGAGSAYSTWPLFNGGFGGIMGMDLAPVPAPGAGALALVLGAHAARRRRR